MSEIQKCPNLVRGGGGVAAFFKNVWNSKMSQLSYGMGGRVNSFWDTVSKFTVLNYLTNNPIVHKRLSINFKWFMGKGEVTNYRSLWRLLLYYSCQAFVSILPKIIKNKIALFLLCRGKYRETFFIFALFI